LWGCTFAETTLYAISRSNWSPESAEVMRQSYKDYASSRWFLVSARNWIAVNSKNPVTTEYEIEFANALVIQNHVSHDCPRFSARNSRHVHLGSVRGSSQKAVTSRPTAGTRPDWTHRSNWSNWIVGIEWHEWN